MIKKNLLIILCFCSIAITFSQEKEKDIKKERKNAIGISAGLPGFGFEYARLISHHFTIRLRYNSLNVKDYEIQDFELDGQNTDIILNAKNKSYDLLIEYLPFKSSSFKLLFGAGYFKDLLISGNMTFDTEQKIGDITLTKDDFGDLNIEADWSENFAPYLGIGFGRAIPKKRLGIALEIGGYFIGEPNVILKATRLLTPTEEENKETIQEGFKKLNIIPHIKLKLAYSF